MIKKFIKEFFTNTFILDEWGMSQTSSIKQFTLFYFILYSISLFLFTIIHIVIYFIYEIHLLFDLKCLISISIGTFFIMICSYFISKRYNVRGIYLCLNTTFWLRVLIYSPVLIIRAERERKLKIIEEIMNS